MLILLTKNIPRYLRMVNADTFTELSANVDCIAWDIDNHSDDVDTCHEQFVNKFTQLYDKSMPLKLSAVKNKKIKKHWLKTEILV